MQFDMHFYGVYALARAAGVKPKIARTIAHASQFVDDAIEDEAVVLEEQDRAILPTMTSHKPIDYQNTIPGDQWKVWVPFHFLPGNDENAKTFLEKMVCRKNSLPAKQMLEHALKHKEESFGPHLAGITAHVYADTFAHHGFVGLSRDWNRVKNESVKIHVDSRSIKNYLLAKFETFQTRVVGMLAETVPVGHGAVGTFPDRPYLQWEYEYEPLDKYGSRKPVDRKNLDDFTKACERLHNFFGAFATDNTSNGDPDSPRSWLSIADRIHSILKENRPMDERIEKWKKAISSNDLFSATDEDKIIGYSKKAWKSANIIFYFDSGGNVENSDACLYIKAAWKHRNYVFHELLPGIGLISR